MTSPPRKKPKISIAHLPAAIKIAKSASKHAQGQGSDEAFEIKRAELHEFFPNSTSGSQILSEVDRQNVNITIDHHSHGHEKDYRNAIYRQLINNEEGNLETVPGTSGTSEYNEIELIRLFKAFVEENTTDGNGDGARDRITPKEKGYLEDSLRREEPGLKITTSSKPDLSFLRRSNSAVEFVLGEVKYEANYTSVHAEQQVACYLQALLYFLRVKIGLPVTAVHGFTVCGPDCKDMKSPYQPEYGVSFVKLAAPQTLNGKFKVSSYLQTFETSNPNGLKLLAHFLKHGHFYEYHEKPVRWEERRKFERRCPSLFSVPPVLWKDIDNERELVANGTLAAVFRVYKLKYAQELLGMVAENGKEEQEEGAIRSLKKVFEKLNSTNPFVYVKVHTIATDKHLDTRTFEDIWKTLDAKNKHLDTSTFKRIWMALTAKKPRSDAISDFFDTYPMKPPSFSRCSFIVMYNRGESLLSADLKDRFGTFSCARPRLRELKSKVEELGETCVHSDILPQNVAVDEDGNLALIDYDEAVWFDSSSPERAISDDADLLRYPNVLRTEYKKKHAAVQFSLIVRFIAEALECSEGEKGSLESLCDTHDDLAKAMKDQRRNQVLTQTLPLVEDLVEAVDSMLSEENTAAIAAETVIRKLSTFT